MDVGKLISGFIPTDESDTIRKNSALDYAFSLRPREYIFLRNKTKVKSEYLAKIPKSVTQFRFGGISDDFYFTALFSTICQYQPNLDVFWAAVLNKLCVQLTFQTRYFFSGLSTDIFLLDGDREYFSASLANSNLVFGLLLGQSAAPPIPWGKKYAHIAADPIRRGACTHADLPETLSKLNFSEVSERKVGCLALTLPRENYAFDYQERSQACSQFVDRFTSYAVC